MDELILTLDDTLAAAMERHREFLIERRKAAKSAAALKGWNARRKHKLANDPVWISR